MVCSDFDNRLGSGGGVLNEPYTLLNKRKVNVYARSLPLFTFYLNFSPVFPDDPANDQETQSCPGCSAGTEGLKE